MKEKQCNCAEMHSMTSTWTWASVTWKCAKHGSITVDRLFAWQTITYPYPTYPLYPLITYTGVSGVSASSAYTFTTESAN